MLRKHALTVIIALLVGLGAGYVGANFQPNGITGSDNNPFLDEIHQPIRQSFQDSSDLLRRDREWEINRRLECLESRAYAQSRGDYSRSFC